MKVRDLLEATSKIGIVVDNVDGKFEDVIFLDYDILVNNNEIADLTGHLNNIGKGIIALLKEENLWNKLEPFLKKVSKGKALGADYGDNDATLYGPFTPDTFEQLSDKLSASLR